VVGGRVPDDVNCTGHGRCSGESGACLCDPGPLWLPLVGRFLTLLMLQETGDSGNRCRVHEFSKSFCAIFITDV
jgi:hypothetical protein